jgi:hypothetical protein
MLKSGVEWFLYGAVGCGVAERLHPHCVFLGEGEISRQRQNSKKIGDFRKKNNMSSYKKSALGRVGPLVLRQGDEPKPLLYKVRLFYYSQMMSFLV